jgi:hypothetical protein
VAFPAVQGTPAESSTNTAGTSHVVTLPTGIQAGELLLVFIDKGSTAATFNALAGWTELLDENLANGIAILYRWADGTEGASITLTSSASTRSARIAYRIAGAANPGTTPPTLGTVGTGTSTTPNPGNCNPGTAKDYLWFTLFGGAGEEADDDTWCNSPPSTYGNLLQKACGTAGTNLGGKIAVAYKQANAASDDAGTFSQDVSTAWRAYTVAVHPTIERRGRVSWAELETPNAPRRARVSWAEFEAPTAPRRARVSWAEFELPDAATPRRARVSWAELEVPNGPRRAQVSWAELETPNGPRRAQVSWAELETPNGPRRVRVSWAELEAPDAPRRARVSWVELEVPTAPRRAQVSWTELEVPTAPRRAQVSWAELETPDGPRRALISWTELEVPDYVARRARVSWVELETPDNPLRRALISWAELEVPAYYPLDADGMYVDTEWGPGGIVRLPSDTLSKYQRRIRRRWINRRR